MKISQSWKIVIFSILGIRFTQTFEISQIGLWFQSNWSIFWKLQFYWLSWAEHCFFWLSIVLKTSTCCSFTNDHIPIVFLPVWVNTGQLYLFVCVFQLIFEIHNGFMRFDNPFWNITIGYYIYIIFIFFLLSQIINNISNFFAKNWPNRLWLWLWLFQ